MKNPRILLVQLFSNGDCLYATAVARQIRQDYPSCHLTWAIASWCRSIVANDPSVDDFMEVTSVPKGNEAAFRKFVKQVKNSNQWDKIIITHVMGSNIANYDGCIRSALFRGYKYPLTVDIQPSLELNEEEIKNAKNFAEEHNLKNFSNVILFEFAPLSGQSLLEYEQAIKIAETLADNKTGIILSSANKVSHSNKSIIDGSVLSIRETAALTRFCTFMIGCTSGITWITTTSAAEQLPMVQLLDPKTTMINPVSRDFKRFNLDDTFLIELLDTDPENISNCVKAALEHFDTAKIRYHQHVPLHFKSTRNIIYMLLCYLEFSAIAKHINVNREVFGDRLSFYREVAAGFLIFPFRLVSNLFKKRLMR